MKHALLYAIAAVLVLSHQACGSDDDDADDGATGGMNTAGCDVTAACGGDIRGEWKASNVCYDDAVLVEIAKQICADATIDVTGVTVSGDVSYNADMSFVQGATSVKGSLELRLSAACLKGVTCEAFESMFSMEAMGAGSATCTAANGGGCTCKSELSSSSQATGTYTVSGNTIVLKAGDDTESQNYCVKGSQLVLFPSATADVAEIPPRVVLTRK